MANKVKRPKMVGMGGSNCGKGRSQKTADMKKFSKKKRRLLAKKEAVEFQNK
jgi:hypothetical protein